MLGDAKGRRRPAETVAVAPSGLVLGAIFCVVGGVLITLATFFPWVHFPGREPAADLLMWDLAEADGNFLLMFIIPFAGILVACLSLVSVMGGERWGPRWLFPVATALSAVAATLLLVISVAWIHSSYVAPVIEVVKYGSAAFLVAFGCVLAVAGSAIMTLWKGAHREARGAFKQSFRSRTPARMRVREMPAREAMPVERCPKCDSPIEGEWRTCPICGERL